MIAPQSVAVRFVSVPYCLSSVVHHRVPYLLVFVNRFKLEKPVPMGDPSPFCSSSVAAY